MKIRYLAAIAALILVLASCSNAAAPGETQTTAGNQETAGTQAPAPASFSEQDLIFAYNGAQYELLTDAAPLLAALGEDYEVDAAPSCVYSQYGDDKTFAYNDILIYTNPTKDGKDMFYEIDIVGGDYATTKGIKIGSTLDEIKAAYGNTGFEDGDYFNYNLSGDPQDINSASLSFKMDNGAVTAITYYYPTNLT